MIGTKNFWANLALIFGFLGFLYLVYLGMLDAKIEAKATIWLGIAGIFCTWLLTSSNKRSDLNKQELDSKAPTSMVITLEKKVDDNFQNHKDSLIQHAMDNRESMAALFDQQRQMIGLLIETKDTNTKENKEIAAKLEQVLKEARCEVKTEAERDNRRKEDFENR